MLKKHMYLLLFLLGFFLASCQSNQQNSMAEKHKAAFVALMGIMDGGDVDELGNYIADNVIDHASDPMLTTKKGLEGVKDVFRAYHKAFPEMKTTIHTMAVSGDTLFAYITSAGTTAEPFMGMPANYQMKMGFVDILRFEGGKVAEHWGFMDMTDMMKMMPKPEMMDENMMKKKGM